MGRLMRPLLAYWKGRRLVLVSILPLLLLAAAFIVICCDPELRDAQPVASNKPAVEDRPFGLSLLHAALAGLG